MALRSKRVTLPPSKRKMRSKSSPLTTRKRSFSISPDRATATLIATTMNLKRFIRLDFIPASVDCGLLLLRVWLGLSMFLIHGLDKLKNFGGMVAMFRDNMHVPAPLGAG